MPWLYGCTEGGTWRYSSYNGLPSFGALTASSIPGRRRPLLDAPPRHIEIFLDLPSGHCNC